MPGWNFADAWEVVAQQIPDGPALVHGDRRISWAELDRRANGVAQAFLDAGVAEQDKVAQYLYNGTEYLESVFATFKAGLVPINTNYRYLDDELLYLWDNGDVVAVVFHGTFAERIEGIRHQLPRIKLWLWVDDGAGDVPLVGHPLRGRGGGRVGGGRERSVGPRRRPPAAAVHGGHHGHAEGRDVAPGRPLPRPGHHGHPRRAATPRPTSSSSGTG